MYGVGILHLVKEPRKKLFFFLTLSKTTNFRQSHTERVCRRQFHVLMKMAESSPKRVENIVGKGEITSNLPFSHMAGMI